MAHVPPTIELVKPRALNVSWPTPTKSNELKRVRNGLVVSLGSRGGVMPGTGRRMEICPYAGTQNGPQTSNDLTCQTEGLKLVLADSYVVE